MTQKFWVMQVPVISTAHVPNERAFDGLGASLPVAEYEEGWFIYVRDGSVPVGAPDWLEAIFKWAKSRDYRWVRLDRDGDVIDELPQFDW